MSGKQVKIGARPTGEKAAAEADAWVGSRTDESKTEPMKRLTLDIPESLHRRIKVTCAGRGTKMADELRTLLLKKYGES